jgi:3-oxoacyl-[acyl-carrier protein] reductase
MRSVARDEGVHGITANAVLPGWIETDTQTSHEANQGKRSALGRSGKPEEVASTIAWLASKEAGYITGQAIVVDGGNSIAEERA